MIKLWYTDHFRMSNFTVSDIKLYTCTITVKCAMQNRSQYSTVKCAMQNKPKVNNCILFKAIHILLISVKFLCM